MMLGPGPGRHHTQHNDIQHNGIQPNNIQHEELLCDTQHK
jgi:hypothetical protein